MQKDNSLISGLMCGKPIELSSMRISLKPEMNY